MGMLFCSLIVLAEMVAKGAMLVRRDCPGTPTLKIRVVGPLVATPVTAGLAETSPAQAKLAAREATAAMAVARPAPARLAMAVVAVVAVLLVLGRGVAMALMVEAEAMAALAARQTRAWRATVEWVALAERLVLGVRASTH